MTPALANCAPYIAPATLSAIVSVESGGNPLAVNVNGIGRFKPATLADAIAIARHFVAHGHRVDLGLMQVDSANLEALGYSIRAVFAPCTNIRAGAWILAADYRLARRSGARGQAALAAALSAYNTGSLTAGFANGYVARYGLTTSMVTNPAAAPMAVYRSNTQARWRCGDSTAMPHPARPSMTVYRRDDNAATKAGAQQRICRSAKARPRR